MSTEFSSQLRARPGTLRLVPDNAPNVWTIRVQVAEAWDMVRMEVAPSGRITEAKQAALNILMPDANDGDAYEVKYRGVLVDEANSFVDAGVVDGGTLLVIGRRKRPVR